MKPDVTYLYYSDFCGDATLLNVAATMWVMYGPNYLSVLILLSEDHKLLKYYTSVPILK